MLDPVSRALHRSAGQHGPIMLMYHAVQPGKGTPDWPWAVSMQRFREQLDFLATEGYATPTMAELVDAPAKKWDGRTAVITFDDGYADNLAACEELQKRGMRATWFIVSGSVGQSPRWPADGRPGDRLLNSAELCEMQENGMEIGSHTVSHARLPDADDERLMRELGESKASLESMLGHPVSSFAYPYGAWDERCANAVKQAGYAASCTTQTGWALRDKDPYRLRRLTVFNTDTLGSFARKLYFGSHDVAWRDIAGYALRRLRRV
ncbi:polysaccharide deacetylase family protein [Thiobacillus sp.]|uniref:polysaccharide deacetylase family protein n=1 Tax=Thiobacillus sp. TaxID=924 RepID=UPI00391B5C6C